MRCYRILLIAAIGILAANLLAESKSLLVEHCGDHLSVSAPQMHFLEGKAQEKLHNGSTVTYVFSLAVSKEHAVKPYLLLERRFLVSYDLWEEKYSVVQADAGGRAASRLTAAMTEAWCLGNMAIPLQAVPERQSFMIRLECSIEENENGSGEKSSSGLTLTALIDIFSRKRKAEPLEWKAASGPLRLDDLKRIDER